MKRLTAILIAGIFVLAPLSASAMEMMSDSNMKDVTGQAGVSIAVDDVVLEQWTGETRYIDNDGTDGTKGAIVLSGQHTVTDIQAIAYDSSADFRGANLHSLGKDLTENDSSAGVARTADQVFKPSAITIDVGTCKVMSRAKTYGETLPGQSGEEVTIAGVVIGLPTVEVNTSSDSLSVTIEQEGAANNGGEYIEISEGFSTLHVLDGTVEIAPH